MTTQRLRKLRVRRLRKLLESKAIQELFPAMFKRKTGRLEPTATPVMWQMKCAGLRGVEIAKIFDVAPSAVAYRLRLF